MSRFKLLDVDVRLIEPVEKNHAGCAERFELFGEMARRGNAEGKSKFILDDLNKVLTTDDLISGEDIFFAATGVTDGELLRGVRYDAYGARSHSLVMRSRSGTIRYIDTHHRHDRLAAYSSTDSK